MITDYERAVHKAWQDALDQSELLLDFAERLHPDNNRLGKRATASVRIVGERGGDSVIRFRFLYDDMEETT